MMKQCDRNGLSPFAPPLAIDSSSLSFAASESDPEDSFWRDFTFDFSFLTSDEQKIDSTTVRKAEESEAVNPRLVKEKDESSKLSPSLSVVSTSGFDSNVTIGEERSQHFSPTASVLGVTSITPVAKNDAIANEKEVLVGKDINESHFSPLFTKLSALSIKECSVLSEKFSIPSDLKVDTEVDSPCWRGTLSHNTATSSTKSFNFRRCKDDLNVLYRLNPLAPQFIPSDTKKIIDGKEFELNHSSSLKRSLSSTFSPSSGEFSITDPCEAGIEQGSDQNARILIHDGDESLGLVSQDSVSKAMSIMDIDNQFQSPKKLDPLAPVFVPASPKLSAVIHDKHRVADYLKSRSPDASSSSDNRLLNCVKPETHSSEAGHSFRNPYSNESGKAYSFNPRMNPYSNESRSPVQISENTKLDGSSNKTHGSKKKLNPLAPQFSLGDIKPKVRGSEKNQAANDLPPKVNSAVLFPPVGYKDHTELHAGLAQSSVHVEVDTKQMGRHRPFRLPGNSSPRMDIKKLLTTIHGLSELLTHVHGSETSDPPNGQDLDLINCTVQNLNSYINSRAQEHVGNYAGGVHSSRDLTSLPNMREQSIKDHQMAKYMSSKRKEKYSMVSREIGADSQFGYGFGQVVRNHQTEEQINPQVYFYRSLWLKAKADRSLMEYETFLSNSRT